MLIPTLDLETQLWEKGYKVVCGVDEVGRGCFAGPVVVGAVIFSPNSRIPDGIADSKKLSIKKRIELTQKIKDSCLAYSTFTIDVPIINEIGIGKATQLAFKSLVDNLKPPPDFVLVDAFTITDFDIVKQAAVQDGDGRCLSIAAASIIAKVYRDKLMEELDLQYPDYQFAKHKGYGTKVHQEAIKKYGLCKLHRTSFNLQKFI
ncbi:MAG: ribonuclease HII [Candidatus Daviesbacteria bacterium]|nr:ribonuclease HII [Candidatus Daviesbacteria bacterium]